MRKVNAPKIGLEDDLLIADASASIAEVLEIIVPQGFFLPVVPGTKFVTLGGAIAADIHGKNHHIAGSFGNHVQWFEIETAEGKLTTCSRDDNPDLFRNSIGGMGLTGIIRRVAVKLKPISGNQILQERLSFESLEEVLEAFDTHANHTYSVAWIDCMSKKSFGRSVLFLGEHAEGGDLKTPIKRSLNIPFFFPAFSLNEWSIAWFNRLYFWRNRKQKQGLIDYDSFFFPLDSIHNWNRIYGRNGFTQYQFVVPFEKGSQAILEVIEHIQSKRIYPFLTVLKAFGKGNSSSALSFPMPGYTLALDFKICKSLFPFLDGLDAIILRYGGRVYLAKDCRLSKENFKKMYPMEMEKFGESAFSSLLSQRIGLR